MSISSVLRRWPVLCRFIAFAAILPCWPAANAGDGATFPVLIVFDSKGTTPEAKLEYIRLVNEFCPAEHVRPVDDALIAKMQNVFHKFDDPAGFDAVGGVAHSINRGGEFSVSRFRTVKSKETFEAFLALHAAKRGAAVEVIREGNQIIMKDSSPGEKRPSGAIVRWVDAYFAYSHDIVAWGDKDAFLTPFDELSEISGKAEGHDWCVYAAPSGVPSQHFAAFLKQVELQTGVFLQRRDNEQSVEYAVRKELGESGLEILRRIVADVDEFWMYTDEPNNNEGFRAHLEIAIRDRSPLAKLIAELRPVPAGGFRNDGNNVSSGGLCIGIPEFFRPALLALIANSQLSGTAAENAAVRIVEGGKLEVGFLLASNAEGEPSLTVEVVTDILENEFTSLANLAGNNVDADGQFQIPLAAPVLGQDLVGYLITGQYDADRLRIVGIRRSAQSSEGVKFPEVNARLQPSDSRDTEPLLKLDVDLHRLAELDTESAVRQLLVQFERMYQWYVGTHNPVFLRRRGAAPLDDFVSLVPNIRSDGDWTLHLELRASGSGERMVADCRIGRELYGLLQARRLVTQRAIFRSR